MAVSPLTVTRDDPLVLAGVLTLAGALKLDGALDHAVPPVEGKLASSAA